MGNPEVPEEVPNCGEQQSLSTGRGRFSGSEQPVTAVIPSSGTIDHEIISLLVHNCNFAIVLSHNVYRISGM